jgi:F-type H+-transporting ATPase subunit a
MDEEIARCLKLALGEGWSWIRSTSLRSRSCFRSLSIGGMEIAFTNSALFMLIGLLLILLLMLGATARARWCRTAAVGRGNILRIRRNDVAKHAGTEGMKFFPLVFSLFMFILVLNVIGIIPYTFTVTSHIIITCSLALLVFFTVIIYGFWKNGLASSSCSCRAESDLHSAAGDVHRSAVVPFAAGFPQRSAVREHACRPHHAESVRRLRDHAGCARLPRLAWSGLPLGLTVALTALELLVAFLQPTFSQFSPASISTMRSTRATNPPSQTSKRSISHGSSSRKDDRRWYMPASAWAVPASGVGTIFGHLSRRRLAQSLAAQGQFGNLIFGFCCHRGARHLLVADRAVAAVRPLTSDDDPTPAASCRRVRSGVVDGSEERAALDTVEHIPSSEAWSRGFRRSTRRPSLLTVLAFALAFMCLYC